MTDIRLAVAADHDRLVDTVVAAFDQDPAFRAFFGNGPDFEELARAFAADLLARRIQTSSVWMTVDGDAVAMWDPPAGSVDTPPSQLQLPADAAARLADYDQQVHAAVPSAPHWYLGILASHPSRRGEGLARRVAEAGLMAASDAGVAAILETTNPGNVALYERAGWTVIAELSDVIGLTVWVMEIAPGA